ncbi:MAG: ABC transporter transmembrane domain-containing protein [Chloroflexi bacterium]|nr:ABC transporter transmembrane domain-containing protein [Chloroflexota bacterium]
MAILSVPKLGVAERASDKVGPQPLSLFGGIRYIFGQWQRYWPQGLLVVLSLIIHELFRTYFALRLKAMVDSLQATGQVKDLAATMLILVVGFFIALAARLLGERLLAKTGVKILNHLRTSMFEHLQRLSYSYYTRMSSGNILSRFSSDLADVEKVVTLKLRDGLLDVILLLLNLPVLFYIDWRLGLVPLVNMIVMTYVVGYFMPKAARSGYDLKTAEAQLTGELQENIRAQALIRAFGFEPLMLSRFNKRMVTLEETGARASLMRALVSLSARSIVLFSRVISVGVGVWLVMRGSMTVGDLVAFLNLFTLINNAIDDLTRTVLPDFIAVTSGIQRIEELLQEVPDIVEQKGAKALAPLRRQIRLQDVSFSYTGQANQLQEINLTIPAGKTVAIVGPSGSGKSTLLALLMRSREVSAGAIAYDGVDLRNITRASLQKQTGVVFQETYLFDTTIRENIRMAKPEATDAEVEQAAKLAEIHELIMGLPNQYDTPVGEAGGRLSGGQRQRIAIARAIIRNPAILILDEATSALDPGTEAAINATLQRLGRSRTVISVTHRLSSITQVDYIVVLNAGRLAEAGKHATLLKQQGLYAQLWQKQSGFEISSDGRTAKVHATYLRQVAIFAALDTATLSRIASRFNTQYVNQGQLVFQQGDVGDRFYLIARGQVEVLVRNALGVDQKIDVMSDGDHFGETALVQDAPRNATIRTVTNCLFLTLPKREFLALLDELPQLRTAVSKQIERTILNRERQNVSPGSVVKKINVRQKIGDKVLGWWYNRR